MLIAARAAAILAAGPGCGGSSASVSDDADVPLTGAVNVVMQLPSGMVATTANYSLRASDGFMKTDILDFSGTGSVAFIVQQLPSDAEFALQVGVGSATVADECTSSAEFELGAGPPENIVLVPHCTGAVDAPTPVGTVVVQAEIPDAIVLHSITYSLVGPNGSVLSNTVPVISTGQVNVTVQQVPAGEGLVLSLRAASADDAYVCTASETLAVEANQQTTTGLLLQCNPST